jgi:Zn-dependent peptidase ImmA (M78 family)/transcriptional regulator with XRE-family HTH domain
MTPQRTNNLPETPFGARLRAARKMAGLSMEDLAWRLGGLVTKQAISKYEQGRMMPSPEVLEKLVEVLKISTWGASPLRPSDIDLQQVRRFRESPTLFHMENAPVMAAPKVRRAGLLVRLRRKGGEGEAAGGKKNAGPGSDVHALSCLTTPPDLDKRGISACVLSDVQGAPDDRLTDEGLPSLGVRRARYLREWQAGSALNEIRFRAGEKLSAKTESSLRYRIADHLQKYLELESILGAPAAFKNPIAGRPVKSRQEVEEAAAEVRRVWELGTGPVVNLLGLLEDKGIKVHETRGIEGFEGLSGRFGDVPFVAVGLENPADRIRFTAAHELGHVLCDFGTAESPEGECHAFGAAFLLPQAALEKTFTPSRRKVTLGDLGDIKETYGVSLQAIMYRAHGLGLVSDRRLRSFRETLKAKGWLIEEPVTYEGKERAARFRRLLHYAVASDILDVNRAAELAGVTAEELAQEIGDIF